MGNWQNILVLVLAAITSRQAAFPITRGGQHWLVTIAQQAQPGGTRWLDLLQIVARIAGGAEGNFTVGVFAVSIVPLTLASNEPNSPNVIQSATAPASGFVPGTPPSTTASRPPGANGT